MSRRDAQRPPSSGGGGRAPLPQDRPASSSAGRRQLPQTSTTDDAAAAAVAAISAVVGAAPGSSGGSDAPSAPGLAAALPPAEVSMDGLMCKLHLLDYEREFCRRNKAQRRPLAPGYFAYAGRGAAGEQFGTFAALAAWLLKGCGLQVARPKDYDDPNATLATLLAATRGLGGTAASLAAVLPGVRLAAGWGPEVAALLDALAGAALERRRPALEEPSYGGHDGAPDEHEAEVDDGDDMGAVDLAEEAAGGTFAAEEDEEELCMGGAGGSLGGAGQAASGAGTMGSGGPSGGSSMDAAAGQVPPEHAVLVSSVDPVAWKLEAERVAPRLRLALPADMREWRQHLDAAGSAVRELSDGWGDAACTLGRLGSEVGGALERLAAREAALNCALGGELAAYSAARGALAGAQDEVAARSDALAAREAELHRLGAALEDTKAALDARGSSLSDASPLVRIKAALATLHGELGQMEVRIGVVSHTLAQLSLADKQAAARDAAERVSRAGGPGGRLRGCTLVGG